MQSGLAGATALAAVVMLLGAGCSGDARSEALTSLPATTTTTTTTVAVTTTTVARTRPIRGGVTAIGDSLMLDVGPALRATIPGVTIDAAVSRSALPGPEILASLAASHRLGASILFDLGLNGGFSAPLLDRVLAIAAGRRVVLVTNHCPYCSWTSGQNAIMRARCTRARHCLLADWDALAGRHPEWFAPDGVHMPVGGPGAQAYARLVRARLAAA